MLAGFDFIEEADAQMEPKMATEIRFDAVHPALTIAEDMGPGCGGKIWEAATVLCQYLLHISSSTCNNEPPARPWRMMELGAGTGIVSIYACQVLPPEWMQRITVTDLPILCDLMQRNIDRNRHVLMDPDRLHVEPLSWGPLNPDQVDVDVILVSDCVYLESCFQPLLDTLTGLMPSGKDVACWMSYKRRRRADKQFFRMLKKQFHVSVVQDHPAYEEYSRERLFLFEIRRK
jgi:predicted nicotinamide N-methyase